MNIGILENRAVCKFNLRGICRFGTRCWNLHENPEKVTPRLSSRIENQPTASAMEEEGACAYALGACALSPSKSSSSKSNHKEPLREVFGPSTSSVEEALELVKIAESQEKICGICFDTILKKTVKSEQTFGILPNCNHCFCFTCIRKWRQSKEFEIEVSKACPECRIASEFVYPSRVWLETKQDKENFIETQKQRMKIVDCRYFRKGKGKCPFGNTCLYLHALPNGKTLDVGPPKQRKKGSLGMSSVEQELIRRILFCVNENGTGDDDDDLETDGDDDNDIFDLDLDDPYIAIQYYDKDDFRYYIAMNRVLNGDNSSSDDDDYYI